VHGSGVLQLTEVSSGSGRVGTRGVLLDYVIMWTVGVLLEYVVLMTGELWHDVRFEGLHNVAEICQVITAALANILEEHRPNWLLKSDSAPNHDSWTVPWVFLHHTHVCETFAPPSPDPDSANNHGNPVSTFIS